MEEKTEVFMAGQYPLHQGKKYLYTNKVETIGKYPNAQYYATNDKLKYVGTFTHSIEEGYRDNQNRYDYFIDDDGNQVKIDHRYTYHNYYVEC
jgi:hypothetical protein